MLTFCNSTRASCPESCPVEVAARHLLRVSINSEWLTERYFNAPCRRDVGSPLRGTVIEKALRPSVWAIRATLDARAILAVRAAMHPRINAGTRLECEMQRDNFAA